MKGNTIKTVLLAGVCLMLLCSCANNSLVQEPATETEIESTETADVTVMETEAEAAAETEAVTETEKTEEEVDATEELPSTEEKKRLTPRQSMRTGKRHIWISFIQLQRADLS